MKATITSTMPSKTFPALQTRLQARSNSILSPTCGLAPGHLQANLLILPSRYAQDFTLLCARNPVPCPLLAKSSQPGDFENLTSYLPSIPDDKIAASLDIRTDTPRYNIYQDGTLSQTGVPHIKDIWQEDHVTFLIGCSYSFETALALAGLPPPHMTNERNVTMYRTNIPLSPAGIFQHSTMVVSMRFYRASEVERVRHITRPYVTTHGEPVAWGWDGAERIGVRDVNAWDWGDGPISAEGEHVERIVEEGKEDGYVPVFWGCGVTPQEAVMEAKIPGVVVGHTPGYMVILDVKEGDVLEVGG